MAGCARYRFFSPEALSLLQASYGRAVAVSRLGRLNRFLSIVEKAGRPLVAPPEIQRTLRDILAVRPVLERPEFFGRIEYATRPRYGTRDIGRAFHDLVDEAACATRDILASNGFHPMRKWSTYLEASVIVSILPSK